MDSWNCFHVIKYSHSIPTHPIKVVKWWDWTLAGCRLNDPKQMFCTPEGEYNDWRVGWDKNNEHALNSQIQEKYIFFCHWHFRSRGFSFIITPHRAQSSHFLAQTDVTMCRAGIFAWTRETENTERAQVASAFTRHPRPFSMHAGRRQIMRSVKCIFCAIVAHP